MRQNGGQYRKQQFFFDYDKPSKESANLRNANDIIPLNHQVMT
jgi:hypothetical protein